MGRPLLIGVVVAVVALGVFVALSYAVKWWLASVFGGDAASAWLMIGVAVYIGYIAAGYVWVYRK